MPGVGVLGYLGGSDVMSFFGDLRVQHHVELEMTVVMVCLCCCLVQILPPVRRRVLRSIKDVVFHLRRRISRSRRKSTVEAGMKFHSWYS